MRSKILREMYQRLESTYGPQNWWPGDSPFEIILGAILTQNTNWLNVEKALQSLKQKDLISPSRIHDLSHFELAQLIKPAGFFNIKAKRIKNFLDFLYTQYEGQLSLFKKEPLAYQRQQLLSVNGIGPETADSILLYAFEKPTFVIDAYTRRILYRHGLVEENATYLQMQEILTSAIEDNVGIFNEYHALIVQVGKDYCKPKPKCEQCPLNSISYSLHRRCFRCFKTLDGKVQIKNTPKGMMCSNCVSSDL